MEKQIIYALMAFLVMGGLLLVIYISTSTSSLNSIKNKSVGNGQHGTARWASRKEIRKTYEKVKFQPDVWRKDKDSRPSVQGIVVGCEGKKALIDTGDVHAMMIGAAGVGKTAYWMYPNIEFACASSMSFLTTDTKGDLMRNYGTIAKKYYGYNIHVIDLRNPTRSDSNNIMSLVNYYSLIYKGDKTNLVAKSKAEKYAKIISKTIIMAGGDSGTYGQNAYFYDAAEGLLTAVILLVSQNCYEGEKHIITVYKVIQELLVKQKMGKEAKTQFQLLMQALPEDHKAKWFAGAAFSGSDQTTSSVVSTVLSRLNAFLDSELEQILCFDSYMDAERFVKEKSAIFVIMPEENPNVFFMVSLYIQQLYRELLSIADESGGKLERRCIFFCDEFGTLPKIESAEMMFSAARSRRLQIVPVIQSYAQLDKNYGKEGSEIICDNVQLTIFGGFAPSSQSAEKLSKALGNQTVLTGSVSKGHDSSSQSLSMIERPLLTSDELKSLEKGTFVVMKTGTYPMRVKLKLFFKWGIKFEEEYKVKENAKREVIFGNWDEIYNKISDNQLI